MYKATDIANWILYRNQLDLDFKEEAEPITNLKLQKLLYYMQGIHLAVNDEPLFEDEITAWKHGPVVECVYYKFSKFRAAPIEMDIPDDEMETVNCILQDPETDQLLNQVYDHYSAYSAWGLRNMTHNERPWKETEQNHNIDQDLIKEFFKEDIIE